MLTIFRGKEKLASHPHYVEILRSLIGGTLSIALLLFLGKWSGHIWIMAPFGASCVLLYAVPQSPLAQPRNIIFGHFISALIGLMFLKFFGAHFWSIALAVGCAIAMMQLLRCIHPPAGANPLVILLTASSIHYSWSFMIFPVLTGAIALVLIALCINNIAVKQKWPLYGLGLWNSK